MAPTNESDIPDSDVPSVVANFRSLFDLGGDLVCLASTQGYFLEVNDAFLDTLGYTREELLAVPFVEFVHPDDRAPTQEAMADLRIGRPVQGFENRYRAKNGSWVLLRWNSVSQTERDKILAVARDVTRFRDESRAHERYLRLAKSMQRIASIGGWEVDVESGELFWTEEVFRIYELPVSDDPPTVEEAVSHYHPDDIPLLRRTMEECMEKGEPWSLELRFTTAKKREIDVRAMGEAVRRDGRVVALYGTFQDITAEKAARTELHASRERFRKVIDLMPQMIYAKTIDGKFILANQATAAGIGTTVESLIGRTDSEMIGDAETLRQIRDRDRDVSESGEMTRFSMAGPRGTRLRGRTIDLVKIPFPSPPGEPPAVLTVAEDVTGRRHLERRNEVSRALAARLSESRTLAESGRIIAQELYRYFGYDAFFVDYFDEIRNKVVGVYNEDTPLGADTPRPVIAPDTSLEEYRSELRFKDRATLMNRDCAPEKSEFVPMGETSRLSLSLVFAPVRWADKIIGVMSIQSYTAGRFAEQDAEDLEAFASQCGGALSRHRAEQERVLFEDQLQNARRLESLGMMAGGIAHDFNNLLMGIMGNAELALLDVPDDNPAQAAIRDLIRTSQRAGDLCRQMLAYAGQGSFAMEEAAINGLVAEIVRMLEVNIPRHVRVRQHLDRDTPDVKMDVTQVRQILMNLILNASDAIGEDPGEITIRTGLRFCTRKMLSATWIDDDLPVGEYVFFEVRDTGKGMDEATLVRIFDPFFSTKFTGRGLGLASVLGIVRAHSGAIAVKSQPGVGSSFTIYLPALKSAAERKSPSRDGSPSPVGVRRMSGGGTVLFVDDDDVIRSVITRFLMLGGFNVLSASDGLEGLELFRMHADTIDAVVLDMTMPKMGGAEALAEIRRIREDAIVLVSSGYSVEETQERLRNLQPVTFIQKPYKPETLVQCIHDLLTGSPRHP